MIEDLLVKEEGKTLEFKENASSLPGIIKTVVSFANTAGGTIVIGIEDKTKLVVGLKDPLEDEMRIINKISDSITPQFRPNIEIQSYRKKALILIQVPYATGPYYFKKDNELIAYVRFGSTNRIADDDTIATMKGLSKNITFDESLCPRASIDELDWAEIQDIFSSVNKSITKNKAKSIGIFSAQSETNHPSNGGMLLFGKNRSDYFPDAIIRCVRFSGLIRENSIDHIEINKHLPMAIDEVLYFITKNTFTKTTIVKKSRINTPQYPLVAIREAIINAIVHTDYAIKGSSIIVAIFDDRIEITNPGGMPYGLSLDDAIAGSSRARNRVITRTFHLLDLVEQWGSGLQKIIHSCLQHGLKSPIFAEIGSQFRVTIYSAKIQNTKTEKWQIVFFERLDSTGGLSASDAATLWDIDIRSARRRLKKLIDIGLVTKIGTSKNDPYGKYIKRN
jgi:ATP-dependent DNA helicase RecG